MNTNELDLENELGVQVVPIDALFDEASGPNERCDPRILFTQAQIIWGRDVMTRHQFLVYGRKAIQRVASSGKIQPLPAVMIEIDQETDELEKLLALVQVVKGKHDYEASM